MPERIPIAPISFEGYYGVGKGLAQVFEPYDPNKKLQGDMMRKQLQEFDEQRKAKATATPKLEDSWYHNTQSLVKEYDKISPELAKQLADGKITPAEASIIAGRKAAEINSLANITKQQQKVAEELMGVYNKDQNGLYDMQKGMTSLDIWSRPDKYTSDPVVRAQLEEVGWTGGEPTVKQIAEFRSRNQDYVRPKLAYYREKHNQEITKGLVGEQKTEGQWVKKGGGPSVFETKTFRSIPADALVTATQNQFTQALTGQNYKAVQWSAGVKQRVDDNIVITEDGQLETTNTGSQIVQKAIELGLYDPQKGTVMGNQMLTPETLKEALYLADGSRELEGYLKNEEKVSYQLQKNINNNVSIGGKSDDKTKAGYFVTQTQAISELQNSPDWTGLQTEFNTPEKRKTQAYADRLWNMLGQYGKMSVKSDNGYLGYKVPLKTLGESKNRIESANDLQYQETLKDGSTRWVPMNLEGEVSGLELTRGDVAWGYMEGGTWKVADKSDILRGKISATDLKPVTVFQYKLPDQKEKVDDMDQAVVIDSDTVKKAREKAKGNPIRRIYPLTDRAVASSLDASISPAGSYRQDRGAGAGNPYQNPAVEITTEEVDDAFNVD